MSSHSHRMDLDVPIAPPLPPAAPSADTASADRSVDNPELCAQPWQWQCAACGEGAQSPFDVRCSACNTPPPVHFTGEGVGGAAAAAAALAADSRTAADAAAVDEAIRVGDPRVRRVGKLPYQGKWRPLLRLLAEEPWLCAAATHPKRYTPLMQAVWHGNVWVVGALVATHGVGTAIPPRNYRGEDAADVAIRRAVEDPSSLARFVIAGALCAASLPVGRAVLVRSRDKKGGAPPFCYLRPTRVHRYDGPGEPLAWCAAPAVVRLSRWVGEVVAALDADSLLQWVDAANPYSHRVSDAARGVAAAAVFPGGALRWTPASLDSRALHVSVTTVPASTSGAEFFVVPRRLLCYPTKDAAQVAVGEKPVGPGAPCPVAWVVVEVDCVPADDDDGAGSGGVAAAATTTPVIAPRDGATFHISIGRLVFDYGD
eukprot:m.365649 g.365649  ORF g.365649 m.365649 type:complete len:428 (+) comp28088_c0_seq2:364-1647(+)